MSAFTPNVNVRMEGQTGLGVIYWVKVTKLGAFWGKKRSIAVKVGALREDKYKG